jgi:hypothetical protein
MAGGITPGPLYRGHQQRKEKDEVPGTLGMTEFHNVLLDRKPK